MGYHYDPILCMNVPDSTSKARDASWKAWTLYIDGKWVKSFSSSMAPIKEAQKFMKENYPGKVGKLVRNTGSSSGYSISGSEYKDAAPAGVRDANEIPYSELRKDLRSAQVNDVDVYFDPDVDQAAKVNWRSIGSVTPEAAIKFANDIIKAANNAKQITAKYKGKKISY